MAFLFHRHEREWQAECLATERASLAFDPVRVATLAAEAAPARNAIALLRVGRGRKWAALVPDHLNCTHNGEPVAAGLRLLSHADSLTAADSQPVYFSAEETASVEIFAGEEGLVCPRCKLPIERGQPVARCPQCFVIHHERPPDRNCWTFAETCALCDQPSALDAALRWSPEEL